MQDLKVIGVESGSLLLASESGERFRIPVSEITAAGAAKPAATSTAPSAAERRVSPKEIQTHIRAGLSAAEVATITGADISYVQRFEGPVLAEREYVVDNALAVPVHSPLDTGPLGEGSTFGLVIRQRLTELEAAGERWSSWKQPGGDWIIKLAFTSAEIEHDARWSFDPKRQQLAPMNGEAETLSQQGRLTGPLIPKLRAVDRSRSDDAASTDKTASTERTGTLTPLRGTITDGTDAQPRKQKPGSRHPAGTARTQAPDTSRFDSGPFSAPSPTATDSARTGTAEGGSKDNSTEPADRASASPTNSEDTDASELSGSMATMLPFERRRPEAAAAERDNSELLDSLRRRRGQREPAAGADEEFTAPPHSTTQVIDIPLDGYPVSEPEEPSTRAVKKNSTGNHGRRGRASMPSWDEIVFGTRTDDDPA